MSEPKKQHFVPRFYLKNFGTPVFCYDKIEDKIFSTNHVDIGHENYFYEIDGVPKGTLEKLLSDGDGRFSQAYNRIINTKNLSKLTTNERINFFTFLSVQLMRTHEARIDFKQISEKMLDKIFGKEGMNMIPEGLKVTYSDDSIKKFQAQMIIEKTPEIAAMLNNKTWIIQENHSEVSLWTSDNPIALHNQLKFKEGWGNLGILSPGIEIHFPLTPKLLLLSYDPSTHRLISNDVKSEYTIRHNNYQITNSTRFLYSNSDDFDIAKKFLKKWPQYRNPNRERGTMKVKKGSGKDYIIYDRKDTVMEEDSEK